MMGTMCIHMSLVGLLLVHGADASFHLLSASEQLQLHHLRASQIPQTGDLHGMEFDTAGNPKQVEPLPMVIDWWFLFTCFAISILVTFTLIVGLCVCIKFGEGKQAEHWGQWAKATQEITGEGEKWQKIEQKMQTTDVASYVEATDYQQLLKNVASKIGPSKVGENGTNAGAVGSFVAKAFRLNDSNTTAAVLQAMPAKEAMHWLQLQPKTFNGAAPATA